MARLKDLEELVELQAKAIEALQHAAGALKIALEVIQKAHAEKGSQEKIVFVQPTIPTPQPNPYTPYIPTPQPYFGDPPPMWGTGTIGGSQYQGGINGSGGLQTYAQNAQTALQNVSANLVDWQKRFQEDQ